MSRTLTSAFHYFPESEPLSSEAGSAGNSPAIREVDSAIMDMSVEYSG